MPEKVSPRIKRLQRKAEKKEKRAIAKQATNIKKDPEVEVQRFVVGYEYYRTDLCQAEHMVHGPLRKLVAYFKQVGQSTTSLDIRNIGLEVKPVSNSGTYSEYYKGLRDEDVEVKELVAGDSARHFFYVDPANKVVQIIAHINTHTPLNKQIK